MANTPQAIKRVRQALRRRAVNKRTRTTARTLVQKATRVALGQTDADGPEAVTSAIRALDKAAAKGIIHPNNAARRKSRLMAKVNAAHLLDQPGAGAAPATERAKTTASKAQARRRVAAAKASKAAAGRSADRPRTAAGKARVAVTRASRETRSESRKPKSEGDAG